MKNYIALMIFLAHIIFSYLYMRHYLDEDRQKALVRFIFVLFMPIAGFICFFVMDNHNQTNKNEFINDIYMKNKGRIENMSYLHHFQKEHELNKIPMQEALNMNEFKLRRKVIMDTLQDENIFGYLDVLKEAINNKDTETSHYAASVILEMQKKINNRLQALENQYKAHPDKKAILEKLEENYEKIIFGNLYDEMNLSIYRERYKEISDEILKNDSAEEKYYLNRIEFDFKMCDFTHAKILCDKYKKSYPKSEDMVLCNIKYCVLSHNKEQLDEFFEELPNLPVHLTMKSLEYVRFFNAV
ncbi:MAG: hypothetical protein Q4F66_06695 [Clostridium sp.]|nr:hypothetical protein [Clostridium sp.]